MDAHQSDTVHTICWSWSETCEAAADGAVWLSDGIAFDKSLLNGEVRCPAIRGHDVVANIATNTDG